jgi:type IV pilus assembly protein PilW
MNTLRSKSSNAARTSIRGRNSTRGFTLVELMIALLIGLFLLGGLLTLVQGMKRTTVAQNGLGQLMDNERLAMMLITNVVESAGYFPSPQLNTSDGEFPVTGVFTASSQTIFGTGSGTAAAPGDTFTVRYVTAGTVAGVNDGVLDCTGTPSATAKTFTVKFSIDAATTDLVCVLNGGAPIHLVTGISNMQIVYGVQTNLALNNAAADSYWDALTVPNWSNVISAKITLVFNNPLANQPGQLPTISFTRVIKLLNKPSFIA